MTTTLMIMTYLIIKHFIIDFPLQGPYIYKNKGILGHPGGILHAALHGFGTYIAFSLAIGFTAPDLIRDTLIYIAIVDMIIHYFIDYAKININVKMGWTSTNSEYFWWLLGLDQFLHYMTYVGLIWLFWYMMLGA